MKKAALAVGHSILIAVYFILRDDVEYHDLGPDHFDHLQRERLIRFYTRRLEELQSPVETEAA